MPYIRIKQEESKTIHYCKFPLTNGLGQPSADGKLLTHGTIWECPCCHGQWKLCKIRSLWDTDTHTWKQCWFRR